MAKPAAIKRFNAMHRCIVCAYVMFLLVAFLPACGQKNHNKTTDLPKGKLPDTLRVATLYSPTSYFIYRDETMGYDFSLLSRFAQDKNIVLDLKVASSLTSMLEMLDSGAVDLLAYEIPLTAEYKNLIVPCGPEQRSHQVLVQPVHRDSTLITDPTQLIGKDVYVEAGSKYLYRLQNLDSELGGGINIHIIEQDTITADDLIDMVANGQLPLTIVDSDIAQINRTYYSNIDTSVALSFDQKSSWGASPNMPWLADSINQWFLEEKPKERQLSLLKRYFELSKTSETFSVPKFDKGIFSPYDNIFRKYAATIDYDWRLLASQGFHESHFDSTRVSWAGARGIMQIMPRTARAYGLSAHEMTNPEASIRTSTKILQDLDKSLRQRVPDKKERTKFVLAAYNAGLGHIFDAIELAKKYGKNPQIWDGNVELTLQMKSKPEYYTDPVCRAGYFRGRETAAYVREVMYLYNKSTEKLKS